MPKLKSFNKDLANVVRYLQVDRLQPLPSDAAEKYFKLIQSIHTTHLAYLNEYQIHQHIPVPSYTIGMLILFLDGTKIKQSFTELQLKIILDLLDRKDLNNFKNTDTTNNTMLHLAAMFDNTKVVSKILELAPQLINCTNVIGEAAIISGIRRSAFKAAICLFKHKDFNQDMLYGEFQLHVINSVLNCKTDNQHTFARIFLESNMNFFNNKNEAAIQFNESNNKDIDIENNNTTILHLSSSGYLLAKRYFVNKPAFYNETSEFVFSIYNEDSNTYHHISTSSDLEQLPQFSVKKTKKQLDRLNLSFQQRIARSDAGSELINCHQIFCKRFGYNSEIAAATPTVAAPVALDTLIKNNTEIYFVFTYSVLALFVLERHTITDPQVYKLNKASLDETFAKIYPHYTQNIDLLFNNTVPKILGDCVQVIGSNLSNNGVLIDDLKNSSLIKYITTINFYFIFFFQFAPDNFYHNNKQVLVDLNQLLIYQLMICPKNLGFQTRHGLMMTITRMELRSLGAAFATLKQTLLFINALELDNFAAIEKQLNYIDKALENNTLRHEIVTACSFFLKACTDNNPGIELLYARLLAALKKVLKGVELENYKLAYTQYILQYKRMVADAITGLPNFELIGDPDNAFWLRLKIKIDISVLVNTELEVITSSLKCKISRKNSTMDISLLDNPVETLAQQLQQVEAKLIEYVASHAKDRATQTSPKNNEWTNLPNPKDMYKTASASSSRGGSNKPAPAKTDKPEEIVVKHKPTEAELELEANAIIARIRAQRQDLADTKIVPIISEGRRNIYFAYCGAIPDECGVEQKKITRLQNIAMEGRIVGTTDMQGIKLFEDDKHNLSFKAKLRAPAIKSAWKQCGKVKFNIMINIFRFIILMC